MEIDGTKRDGVKRDYDQHGPHTKRVKAEQPSPFRKLEPGVEAPLVFAGFGVTAPEFGHDDLAGVDLVGKIAVVLFGAPRSSAPAYFPATASAWYTLTAAKAALGKLEPYNEIPWFWSDQYNVNLQVLGLPGKPEGVDGGAVEHLFRDGRHKDISDYCRSDVINTYRAWLRYELFRGALGEVEFAASEADFAAFLVRAG